MNLLDEVAAERRAQDETWGEQNHGPVAWLSILIEEVGEAAAEINMIGLGPDDELKPAAALRRFRRELVQIAAVAVAAAECLDRGKWR